MLGGGGAKGLAHIGIIRAIEEAGIPIDMIGGTSIGSFVGGLYADECKDGGIITDLVTRSLQYAKRMQNLLAQIADLTYPATALLKGRFFNR